MQTRFLEVTLAIAVRHVFRPQMMAFLTQKNTDVWLTISAESFRVFEVSLFIAILTNKLFWGGDFRE